LGFRGNGGLLGLGGLAGLHGHAALLDAGALAAAFAQVEDAGAVHVAALVHLHAVDEGGGHGEDALHADGPAHFAHGEGGGAAAALALDHYALVLLDALLVALADAVAHGHGITCLEIGQLLHRRPFFFELLDL